ncbi:MAG: hypothetical protein JRM73_00015 [Nitrososphaerota archaeon]|nr:hypothetical protein [Nitrososphaerota archaeon]
MTNVTFSLPERTVKRLRRQAAESGGRKGAISEIVDSALTAYLDSAEEARRGETFAAKRGEEVVAEAGTLKDLADALKRKGIDWRSVRIVSSEPLEPVVHFGLRLKPA